MPAFVDKNSQSWDVELTIGIARKVFDIGKPESLTAIMDDPYQRFDLLWLLCEKQAVERRIDQLAFDILVADDETYVQANEALLDAIESFFRRINKESLALLMTKTRAAAKQLDKLATAKVSTLDSTITKVVEKAMATVDSAIAQVGN